MDSKQQIAWEFSSAEISWKFPRFLSKERVLVLGLGGSLDIVSAFAIAQVIASVSSPEVTVLYGGADLVAETVGWSHVAGLCLMYCWMCLCVLCVLCVCVCVYVCVRVCVWCVHVCFFRWKTQCVR